MGHQSTKSKNPDKGTWLPFAGTTRTSRPPTVWAMGLTFADHLRETGVHACAPVVFAKTCQSTVSPARVSLPSTEALAEALMHLDPALCRRLLKRNPKVPALLDYEVEVGMCLLEDWPVVAHQQMPRIGFFLANDVTARSVQIAGLGASTPQAFWSASKGFEGFLPVTDAMWCPDAASPDLWPDVNLSTRVNGQLRQQASLRSMLYSPLQLLQYAAAQAPGGVLHRDDVILTGTPAGIALQVPGWKRKLATFLPRHVAIAAAWRSQSASTRFLQPGDVVEMNADWLGQLQLTVETAP